MKAAWPLDIAAHDLTTQGTITLVEYLGSDIFLYVRLPSGQTVLVQAPGKAEHSIGGGQRPAAFDRRKG